MQNYASPRERVITAESQVIQIVGFQIILREEARWCDFEKLKTAAKHEENLVNIQFILLLRDPEAKLRLLDGLKAKPPMPITEMTEFRSQAMIFFHAHDQVKSSLKWKKLGTNSKRPFENHTKM